MGFESGMKNYNLSDVTKLRVEGHLEAASEAAEFYCQENSDDHGAWYELGLIQRQLGDFRKAIASQKNADEIAPNLYHVLIDMGICYRELAEYDDAILCLNNASEVDSKRFESWYYLGMIFLADRHLLEAERNLKQALNVAPKSVDAMFMLGLCARYMKKFDEAEEYFVRILKLEPNHQMAKNLIGQVDALREIERLTDGLLLSGELVVKHGPFKGMQYIVPTVADNLYINTAQKISGLHEAEL